jgi:ABC-type uncharacterized transport system auxiliary subunit
MRVKNYILETPAAGVEQRTDAAIIVDAVDGRKPYMRQRMTISPDEHVLEAYDRGGWAYSPAEMLGEILVTELARRFTFVAPAPCIVPGENPLMVRVYVDAFDHVRRDRRWSAHMRVKYEIVDGQGHLLQPSTWFERSEAIDGASTEAYVQAQDESVTEFIDALARDLERCAESTR